MADAGAGDRLVRAVDRLRVAAARELGAAPARPAPATLEDAREVARSVTDAVLVALEAPALDPGRRAELLRALGRADRMEDRVRRTTTAERERRRTAVERALEQLRTLATTEDLLAAVAPLILDACQARRATIGRIRDDVWSPWLVADADAGTGAHRPGRRQPRALDDLPSEGRVVATGRAVREAGTGDDAGRAVVTVVAPVTVHGAVLAILEARIAPSHVDTGTVGDVERVGDAVGRAFEVAAVRDRGAALDRVASDLRRDLRRVAESGAGAADELPTAEAGARPVVGAPAGAAGRSALTSALTPRQRETLELMAHGLSNAEIADRLVVGVPTVKSHVTAILRAAGALNRAEAIRRHLGDGPTGSGDAAPS